MKDLSDIFKEIEVDVNYVIEKLEDFLYNEHKFYMSDDLKEQIKENKELICLIAYVFESIGYESF